MRFLLPFLLSSLMLFAPLSAKADPLSGKQMPQPNIADAIFLNADIYTGAPSPAHARAIAVRDGRIIVVGTDEVVRKLKGNKTQVIDLGGHFVMPGFNDAHLHLAGGGLEKLNVNLNGAKSLSEMQARIALRVAETPLGTWITGRGWDHTAWPQQQLPTRQDIDALTGAHPAFFTRTDGHIAVANSAALRAAGVTRKTQDPQGGQIDRDPSGEPTGILRESALEMISAKIPAPPPEMRRHAIELALQEAASWGVTSVQDNSSWEDFLVYEDLEREGKLTVRITEWLPFAEPLPKLQEHRAHHPQTDPMLHTGMLKGFLDGSLGSRTAAMLSPYSDERDTRGIPQFEPAKLNQMAEERAGAGFQIGFHAIGDAAVHMALDAFAVAETYAREHNGKGTVPDFRFRVEHAQVVVPSDFVRFRELKVIASMQPSHLLTDMNWASARLGSERAKHSYAWKEFVDHGMRLAFGTDYPVESITPFRGLYAAITRSNEAGTKIYFSEQKLTIEQAIAAYTTGSAYAEFAEKDKGTLEPGMLADFIVLDRDITKAEPQQLLRTRVIRTVVGGKTVYEITKQEQ
jgi:predicted amidohydrolase YtcJ